MSFSLSISYKPKLSTERLTKNQAKKVVRKKYPYATAVNCDPYYGWAIVMSSKTTAAVVTKQRDEETAWIAAASRILEK